MSSRGTARRSAIVSRIVWAIHASSSSTPARAGLSCRMKTVLCIGSEMRRHIVHVHPELVQGDHCRHGVGQVVDEIRLTVLDEVVDATVHEVLDDRCETIRRRRREHRMEEPPVLEEVGRVHLDRDGLLLGVLLGRHEDRLGGREGLVVEGDLSDLLVAGQHPEAVVAVAAGDRAGPAQLGERRPRVSGELLAVMVEVDGRSRCVVRCRHAPPSGSRRARRSGPHRPGRPWHRRRSGRRSRQLRRRRRRHR